MVFSNFTEPSSKTIFNTSIDLVGLTLVILTSSLFIFVAAYNLLPTVL